MSTALKTSLKNTYRVVKSARIEDARCLRPFKEAFAEPVAVDEPPIPLSFSQSEEMEEQHDAVELMFMAAGWEGSGNIFSILLAPCLVPGGNGGKCVVVYYVEQDRDGTAFLALPVGVEPHGATHVKPSAVSLAATDYLGCAAQIMAGLLASGHYTENSPDAGDEEDPRVRRFDHGKDWEKDGVRRRRPCHAVDDTISLLKELEEEVRAQFPVSTLLIAPPGYQRLPSGQWQRRHNITGKWLDCEPPDSEPSKDGAKQAHPGYIP